jgi:hypothetical protein
VRSKLLIEHVARVYFVEQTLSWSPPNGAHRRSPVNAAHHCVRHESIHPQECTWQITSEISQLGHRAGGERESSVSSRRSLTSVADHPQAGLGLEDPRSRGKSRLSTHVQKRRTWQSLPEAVDAGTLHSPAPALHRRIHQQSEVLDALVALACLIGMYISIVVS